MPRIYKNFEVTRLVYSNSKTEYFFFTFLWRFQTDNIETIKMLIGTNNWDVVVESYRKKLEKEKKIP